MDIKTFTLYAMEFALMLRRESKKDVSDLYVADCATEVIRLAKSLHTLAENDCNYGLTSRQETRRANIQTKIGSIIVGDLGLTDVEFDGDPRGAVVKIVLPSGKSNFCVPTR